MNKPTKDEIIAGIIYIVTIGLTLYWYDWKLIIIIICFMWANNIER